MTTLSTLSKQAIIYEVLNYFGDDPSRRALVRRELKLEGGTTMIPACHYYLDGKVCAVGYCLQDPEMFEEKYGDAIDSFEIEDIIQHFKPEYRIEDIEFWRDLQEFHDTDSNFYEDCLSPQGRSNVADLLIKYSGS